MIGVYTAMDVCSSKIINESNDKSESYKTLKAVSRSNPLIKQIVETTIKLSDNEDIMSESIAISFIKDHFSKYNKFSKKNLNEAKTILENYNKKFEADHTLSDKEKLIEDIIETTINEGTDTVKYYNKMEALAKIIVNESKQSKADKVLAWKIERLISEATVYEKQAFETLTNGDDADKEVFLESLKGDVINKISSFKSEMLNEGDNVEVYDRLEKTVKDINYDKNTIKEDVQELINTLQSKSLWS